MSSDNEDKFRSYGHDLSLIKDDRIKALHSYWLSIHNGDTLPSRRQIDPLQFPKGVIRFPAERFDHSWPKSAWALDSWSKQSRGKRMIGYVSMFDVIDDGQGGYRIPFRIAGTMAYGHNVRLKNIQGRELHEVLTPNEAGPTVRDWSMAVRTRRPVAATGTAFWFQVGPRPWEAIALPLSSDGETVDILLTARVPLGE
jgi:hypothetical protein